VALLSFRCWDTHNVHMFVWRADGEPSDDRRQRRGEDQEPAESRRRTADTDDTVLESHEQSSVTSQDQGTDGCYKNTNTHISLPL